MKIADFSLLCSLFCLLVGMLATLELQAKRVLFLVVVKSLDASSFAPYARLLLLMPSLLGNYSGK